MAAYPMMRGNRKMSKPESYLILYRVSIHWLKIYGPKVSVGGLVGRADEK